MNENFWDKVYTDKSEKEVSWFQEHPKTSLNWIAELNLSKDASIIDVGGGNSRLVDHLLESGFTNITVLDISEVALNKLKTRLGDKASNVKYIASNILDYKPDTKFDLWHDRAAFHFLTLKDQILKYLEIVNNSLPKDGNLILSTFSKNGPEKCSGLPVHQYSDIELKNLFSKYFNNTKCLEEVHLTSWGTTQSFVYCGFKKI